MSTRCLNCGVAAHSLTGDEMPKRFICGKCAQSLTVAEMRSLALGEGEEE